MDPVLTSATLRRRFLASLTKALLAASSLALGAVSLRFLFPGGQGKRQPQWLAILAEEDLPARGVKRLEFDLPGGPAGRPMKRRIFVVRKQERLLALSARCTHLGCLVDWSRHRERFVCPCHGGMYDVEGRVTHGPPPAPLVEMPLIVRGGTVYLALDKGRV